MTSIVNNAGSVNAHRNLGITSMKMGKVLEKLSSGYRINRAADDAAGLGISEKMRAQIRGNTQAIRNANDGISMIQTAEGAMDEVHSILQRMRELGVQAANDTYDTAARDSIATEINQLRTEIDRIANSTQFNGQHLLTGALSGGTGATVSGGTLTAGAQVFESTVGGTVAANLVAGERLGSVANGADVSAISLQNEQARTIDTGSLTFGYNLATNEITLTGGIFNGSATLANQSAGDIDITDASTGATVRVSLANLAGTFAAGDNTSDDLIGAALNAQTIAITNDATNAASVTAVNTTGTTAAGTYTLSVQGGGEILRLSDGVTNQDVDLTSLFVGEMPTGAQSISFGAFGLSIDLLNGSGNTIDTRSIAADLDGLTIEVSAASGNAAMLQVGANVTANDQMSIDFADTRASSAGGLNLIDQTVTTGDASALSADVLVNFSQIDGANGIVGSNDRAQALVHLIDSAITTLNTRRSNLGASQNRLESTINSLGVAVENLTTSESRIRDADIAKLSSDLVSKQILQQAGVAMLSQANQMPQAVSQLLRA